MLLWHHHGHLHHHRLQLLLLHRYWHHHRLLLLHLHVLHTHSHHVVCHWLLLHLLRHLLLHWLLLLPTLCALGCTLFTHCTWFECFVASLHRPAHHIESGGIDIVPRSWVGACHTGVTWLNVTTMCPTIVVILKPLDWIGLRTPTHLHLLCLHWKTLHRERLLHWHHVSTGRIVATIPFVLLLVVASTSAMSTAVATAALVH
mmetsp:Transcript_14753/g.20915  ORF Transcript_14753/g.20915 Transcript_14753/m.20915 type:complete len:202 (-) Transcript_14753:1135-1740(-)